MFEFVVYGVVAVGLFAAGKEYGARVEAKALAEALKLRADAAALVADIKASTDAVVARIKKYL